MSTDAVLPGSEEYGDLLIEQASLYVARDRTQRRLDGSAANLIRPMTPRRTSGHEHRQGRAVGVLR